MPGVCHLAPLHCTEGGLSCADLLLWEMTHLQGVLQLRACVILVVINQLPVMGSGLSADHHRLGSPCG